jgi:hypothetical protein
MRQFDDRCRSTNEGDDWRIHVIFDVLPHRNAALVDEFKRCTEYYQMQAKNGVLGSSIGVGTPRRSTLLP